MNQRGRVVKIPPGSPGAIDLQMSGSLLGIPQPVCRPIIGNAVAGFQFQPSIGDEVIYLSEMRNWASGSTGVANPALMSTMNGGESQILHADGRMFYMENGSPGQVGNTILYSDPLGNEIQINAEAGTITLTPITSLDLDGPVLIPEAAPAIASQGLLSIGSGPFDGTSSGHFVGSAAGTELAINAPSGFTGRLADFQIAGVSTFKIDASTGLVTTAGEVSVGGELLVNGIALLESTLEVVGAAQMDSTFDSLGAATMHTTLNVTGVTVLAGTLDFNSHLTATGSAPGLSATGSQFAGIAISGNDTAGSISITSSTSLSAGVFNTFTTVTFATAYPVGYTPRVTLTTNGAYLIWAVSSVSRTGFTINIISPTTSSLGAISVNYHVIATH